MTSGTSNASEPMLTTDLPLTRLHQGKVRDVYALPARPGEGDHVLLVATDRVSAFDFVLPNAVPRKGEVLTRLSEFWYGKTGDVVPNGFVAVLDASNAAHFGVEDPRYFGRSMVMRRAEVLKVECVVRGYLTGSGWKDYQATGRVSGITLPEGLRMAERLIDPLFTPSSKAEPPAHDAPMSFEEVEAVLGVEVANAVKLRSLALYRFGAHLCGERGILVADTKFEFGMIDGEPCLIDEVMTPDSSRFWPADRYEVGRDQPSFDKQPLRDWLAAHWDMQGTPPSLPREVIEATSERYQEAFRRITGAPLPPPAA